LALLQERNIEPEIILYLETPPSATELKILLTQLGISARALLRKGEEAYKTHQLKSPKFSDDELIAFMVQFPKLIERPIVVAGDKAVLGRPPEQVLDII